VRGGADGRRAGLGPAPSPLRGLRQHLGASPGRGAGGIFDAWLFCASALLVPQGACGGGFGGAILCLAKSGRAMQDLLHNKANDTCRSTGATRADRPGRVHAVGGRRDKTECPQWANYLPLLRQYLIDPRPDHSTM
jgi:hypothetical protein